MTELPGTFGRYQVVAHLGRGGMAQVFHGRLQGIGGFERDVAVKVLLPEFSLDPDFISMLLDEARIAGAIVHPNVVGVLDVGRQDDLFYLVMDYVDGPDLRMVLRAAPDGRLPLSMALYIVSEVLRGLHVVHSAVDRRGVPRRIVHRDVSPSNVMLDKHGGVRLGDFGIAHASSRLSRTRCGAVKGKPRYMAPEQLAGAVVDHRADLYAVGVMLCEMLLGAEIGEPRRRAGSGAGFTWSRALAPGLPTDLATILDNALAEHPSRRYADAARFRRDVVAALQKRAGAYGAEELARDVDRLTSPAVPEFDLSDASALFSEEQGPTVPFLMSGQVAPPSLALPPPEPMRALPPPPSLRGASPWKKLGLLAAGAAASFLSITLAVGADGASAPVSLPPKEARAATPLVVRPQKPTTGKLVVAGPAGTRVMIGSTTYPPAPCEVELPVGRYQIKLKKKRAPLVTRDVTIEPGREIALRL